MATVHWVGGAAAVAQRQTFLFGGTIEATDLIRAQVGSKIVDFVAGSTVTATVVSNLVAAWNLLDSGDYPEFAEMTASASTATLILTADVAGKPFTVTLTPLETDASPADAQTIEGAGIATTGTTATASAGANDWSTAANWSSGAVPATGDSVYLEDNADAILYGLAQSAVTLALLEVRASFTGTVGLPAVDQDGTEYPEYRARYLAVSATLLNVGQGSGQGSGRLLIDVGSVACTLTVFTTAGAADADAGAVRWKGTHASNVVNAYAGSLDVAKQAGETAAVATLRVEGDAEVFCGSGTTLTTIVQDGGALTINSAATTITRHGGTLTMRGSGAITTLTNNAGAVVHNSSGTITTYVGGSASTLDRTGDLRAATLTNCTILAGATISDPAGVLVFTNGIILSRCKISEVSLDLGYTRTLTPS